MTSSDRLVGYFGFGSLVNKHTLRTSYVDIVPATLKGWRRHWQTSVVEVDRDIALLSIHRDMDCDIRGMVVIDREDNLPAVDERERGYDRVEITASDLILSHNFDLPERLYVYVGQEDGNNREKGDLLQSYLDAVLQGFHLEYGEEGVRHFVETTIGFERNIVTDRHAPQYPRAVTLTEPQRMLIDAELGAVLGSRTS